MRGAEGWQLSNAQIFPMALHKASLDIFDKAGMQNLRAKSVQLTGYLEFLINELNRIVPEGKRLRVITPTDPEQRGAQLSILAGKEGRKLFENLTQNGVIADWREPDVIRMAPAPLYNSFEDMWQLMQVIKNYLTN